MEPHDEGLARERPQLALVAAEEGILRPVGACPDETLRLLAVAQTHHPARPQGIDLGTQAREDLRLKPVERRLGGGPRHLGWLVAGAGVLITEPRVRETRRLPNPLGQVLGQEGIEAEVGQPSDQLWLQRIHARAGLTRLAAAQGHQCLDDVPGPRELRAVLALPQITKLQQCAPGGVDHLRDDAVNGATREALLQSDAHVAKCRPPPVTPLQLADGVGRVPAEMLPVEPLQRPSGLDERLEALGVSRVAFERLLHQRVERAGQALCVVGTRVGGQELGELVEPPQELQERVSRRTEELWLGNRRVEDAQPELAGPSRASRGDRLCGGDLAEHLAGCLDPLFDDRRQGLRAEPWVHLAQQAQGLFRHGARGISGTQLEGVRREARQQLGEPGSGCATPPWPA